MISYRQKLDLNKGTKDSIVWHYGASQVVWIILMGFRVQNIRRDSNSQQLVISLNNKTNISVLQPKFDVFTFQIILEALIICF